MTYEEAVNAEQYEAAGEEALDALWAGQVEDMGGHVIANIWTLKGADLGLTFFEEDEREDAEISAMIADDEAMIRATCFGYY